MFTQADLTDYGQAAEVLAGVDAVVHLANIPAPGLRTPAVTFNENMTMNYNVFSAAAVTAGLSRVVWASSETTLGLPFDTPPRYAPVDEDHYPVPTTSYALSKVASETIAEQIAGWSGKPFVALRFSNIFTVEDYQELPWALGGPGPAPVEPVGLHRRAGRGGGLPAGPGGGRDRQLLVHHRRRRHRDAEAVRGTAQGGLPGRPAEARGAGARHAAGHRPGPRGARLRTPAFLA